MGVALKFHMEVLGGWGDLEDSEERWVEEPGPEVSSATGWQPMGKDGLREALCKGGQKTRTGDHTLICLPLQPKLYLLF